MSKRGYDNIIRPGVRSSVTPNPKSILEDIDERIRTLRPEATPIQTLSSLIGRGAKPKSHKIQVIQYHSRDNYDFARTAVTGEEAASGKGYERFIRLTLEQPSRQTTGSTVLYHPQDKLWIAKTNQVVEVVMTPRASIRYDGENELVVPEVIAGTGASDTTTTNRSASNTVVCRVVQPVSAMPLATSDVIYLGRTIHESQRIEAEPHQRDLMYDCNFVEHKEKVLVFTEDQKNLVQMRGIAPDWNFNQQEMMEEFKMEVDYNMLFGQRAVNIDVPGRPKRHLMGLRDAIKTNVSVYNPDSVVNFEDMFSNFMFEQAFRYNPNGYNKIALCGGRFLMNFNDAFKDYRTTTTLDVTKDKTAGMDLQSYVIPGGMKLTLIRNETFRQNSQLENWCFVIDPMEAELRVVKDYASRMYSNNDERDMKLMVEWQGSIAWHREQSHALLKTN